MTTAFEALAKPAGAPAVSTGIPLRLILLLTAAMFINYADRGSLSLAAPLLKDRFGLSNAQMGLLLSAFFWSYAAAQPLAGAIAQRFSVRTVLAVGLAVWAGATAACVLRPEPPQRMVVLAVADLGLPVGSQTDDPSGSINDLCRAAVRAGQWPLMSGHAGR